MDLPFESKQNTLEREEPEFSCVPSAWIFTMKYFVLHCLLCAWVVYYINHLVHLSQGAQHYQLWSLLVVVAFKKHVK